MERLHVYSGALAVIGLSIGLPAVRSLAAGEHGIPTLLVVVGGGWTVVGAVYESLRTDPDEFRIPAAVLLVLVGAAGLSLLGTLLSALSGT